MAKKPIGMVTLDERDEIIKIIERRYAFEELLLALNDMDLGVEVIEETRKNLIKDLELNTMKYSQWWSEMGEKKQWTTEKNSLWNLNFETCEVFLVKQEMVHSCNCKECGGEDVGDVVQ